MTSPEYIERAGEGTRKDKDGGIRARLALELLQKKQELASLPEGDPLVAAVRKHIREDEAFWKTDTVFGINVEYGLDNFVRNTTWVLPEGTNLRVVLDNDFVPPGQRGRLDVPVGVFVTFSRGDGLE